MFKNAFDFSFHLLFCDKGHHLAWSVRQHCAHPLKRHPWSQDLRLSRISLYMSWCRQVLELGALPSANNWTSSQNINKMFETKHFLRWFNPNTNLFDSILINIAVILVMVILWVLFWWCTLGGSRVKKKAETSRKNRKLPLLRNLNYKHRIMHALVSNSVKHLKYPTNSS